MPEYKITYADGTTKNILADNEDFPKEVTFDGGSYELITPPAITDSQRQAWEKDWRNRELALTDFIVPLSDHPQRDKYMTYRTKLRDWPSTEDFPTTRPTLES